MPLPILICDDSSLARRQMVRALPPEWNVDISFATNGREALTAIQQGRADLMFLDLNMPEMSGYEVLEKVHSQDLPSLVVVVSGDVQQKAQQRVQKLGALAFLRKPVLRDELRDVLQRYGLLDKHQLPPEHAERPPVAEAAERLPAPDFADTLREVSNVAMGRAAEQLGQLLSTFITLPVPLVHHCAYNQLPERLHVNRIGVGDCAQPETPSSRFGSSRFSAVSHGFKGNGLAGEGIIMLRSHDIPRLDALMYQDLPDNNATTRILTDLSELLLGACLKALSDQLDLELHHTYPVLLGHQLCTPDLLRCRESNRTVLAIEVRYELSRPHIDCYLLLLLTEDSIGALKNRIELLAGQSC